jgi:hypothetical protein
VRGGLNDHVCVCFLKEEGERGRLGMNGGGVGLMNLPTLQCTNQESVDRLTVPRIPIRQCCFVRVKRDVVGGSV